MSPPPAPVGRPRPRALWFAVGGLLMAIGVVVGVTVIVLGVRGATRTDGVVSADGAPHRVSAPAGEELMVFVPQGSATPSCRFADGSGSALALRAVFGSSTVTTGDQTWVAVGSLDDSGDGALTATCTSSAGTPVRLGAPITVGGIGGTVLGAMAAFLGLGGLGFVVLLVTTILWLTRPRRTPA